MEKFFFAVACEDGEPRFTYYPSNTFRDADGRYWRGGDCYKLLRISPDIYIIFRERDFCGESEAQVRQAFAEGRNPFSYGLPSRLVTMSQRVVGPYSIGHERVQRYLHLGDSAFKCRETTIRRIRTTGRLGRRISGGCVHDACTVLQEAGVQGLSYNSYKLYFDRDVSEAMLNDILGKHGMHLI